MSRMLTRASRFGLPLARSVSGACSLVLGSVSSTVTKLPRASLRKHVGTGTTHTLGSRMYLATTTCDASSAHGGSLFRRTMTTMSNVRKCALSDGCNDVFGRSNTEASPRVVLTRCCDGSGAGNTNALVRRVLPGRDGGHLRSCKKHPFFGRSLIFRY